MSTGHRAVIEAGPDTIRRLCCDAAEAAHAAAVLEWIDDPFGLVAGQPVAVPDLLRDVLACPQPVESVEVIHPSWWPTRRVELVVAAAQADDIVTRPRSRLLLDTFRAAVVVEIAARLVAVSDVYAAEDTAEVIAEPRIGSPEDVADAVARRVLAAIRERLAVVVIDAPVGAGGAAALAAMIDRRLRPEVQVIVIDALPASQVVEPASTAEPLPELIGPVARRRLPLAIAAVLGVVLLGLRAHHDPPPDPATVSTHLVEGRVTVQVPANWPVRRVTGGPGTPRVEVVSPTDPQQVLHVTQAPALSDTLADVAASLERALRRADADAPGVFVGFDPAGASAGRPAVTYREVRDDHHVDWVVLVDRAVRIGIGCQSGPGGADTLRPACEQAVRSAHALGR